MSTPANDRLVVSTNPRGITSAPGTPPWLAWIADASGGAGGEALMSWTPGDTDATVVTAANALGSPAACTIDGALVLACAVDRGLGFRVEVFGHAVRREPVAITAPSPVPSAVTLCPTNDGALVCWEIWDDASVQLRTARISRSLEVSDVRTITPPGGAHLAPRLAWDGEHAWLAWLAGRGPRGPWQVMTCRVEGRSRGKPLSGESGFPRTPFPKDFRGFSSVAAHSLSFRSRSRSRSRKNCMRSFEEAVRGRDLPATSEKSLPRNQLALTAPGQYRVGGVCLAAPRPGLVWVAWHTDRRPGREADLTRWIEVCVMRDGVVLRPPGPPPRAFWGKLGEDQGLEFPVLATTAGGGVTVLARSSHRWWRFDLGRDGWSEPDPLDAEGWGCRSRSVALAPLDDGRLLWARREKGGVLVSELPPPPRAAPRSVPVSREPRYIQPARVRPRLGGAYLLCFGDIHQHTAHSDATGTAREAYERARDLYGDDFTAVTDHESFLGKRIGPGEWRGLMATCDLFDEPHRFVTLPAYEWTGARHPGPGHRCVYLPDSSMPLLGREHPEARTSGDLIRAVGRLGGLVFPHHVGWTGADAGVHDPSVQTCWEVVSCHGAYEAIGEGPIGQRGVPLEGQFLRDQLERGLRFGFVGGSDGHGLLWHHGLAHRRDSHRTGLTAVLVRELTRPAVFEALRSRRCYATSGVPMILDFAAAGLPMGSEVVAREPVRVSALAEGTSTLRRAELVMSGGEKVDLAVNGSSLRADFVVPPSGPGHVRYVYLRVEQADGDVGWTSPVWLVAP